MRALGLMCGTSLDGIDVALVTLAPRADGYDIQLERAATFAVEPDLYARLRAALPPHEPAPRDVAALDADTGVAFARAARRLLRKDTVDFVASHGVTLYHGAGRSVQIGDPYAIREELGVTVISDFRRADCAAGGEGAPLVPYVDALLFASPSCMRVALNVGGIANLTVLPRNAQPQDAIAWDVGPGNMLLDAFVRRRTNGAQTYDHDGMLAAAGNVDAVALERLLADPYFAQPPPKSTGRERFGEQFLDAYADVLERLDLRAGCATLSALTVEAIVRSIAPLIEPGTELAVSGGGAHNATLLRWLAQGLPQARVLRSDALGVDPDAKEALAFAVLGYELLRGRPAGLPRVTGAVHPVLLGAIVPHRLADLLERVRVESGERTPTA